MGRFQRGGGAVVDVRHPPEEEGPAQETWGRVVGNVFRAAIVDRNGDVNVAYLGMFILIALIIGAIPMAFALAALRMFLDPAHPLDLGGLGTIIGAAGVCFGAAATGTAMFQWGDAKKGDPTPSGGFTKSAATPTPTPTSAKSLR
jgi:hypothetical protein